MVVERRIRDLHKGVPFSRKCIVEGVFQTDAVSFRSFRARRLFAMIAAKVDILEEMHSFSQIVITATREGLVSKKCRYRAENILYVKTGAC